MPDLKTPLLWLLAVLLVGALAVAGIERTRAASAREGAAKARQALAEYKLSVSETTRILQASEDRNAAHRLTKAKEAADAARTREESLRADADGARSELDRLRSVVAARKPAGSCPVPGAATPAEDQHPSAEGVVFLACAAALEEVARAAGGHASDVQTLSESWPR